MNDIAAMPRGDAVAEVNDMVSSDGRNRRAAETRRKVIEAAKAMIAETSEAPTVVGVAKRADVSVRSVFQHFGDVESLFVTVVDSIGKDLGVPATDIREPLPLPDRRLLIARPGRAAGYDQIVPLRVAAGQFVNHQGLIERGMVMQKGLRDAAFRVFEHEFALLSAPAKEGLADAIGVALSLDAWVVLRRRDGLSVERAIGRLAPDAGTALLGHPVRGRGPRKAVPTSPIDLARLIRDLRAQIQGTSARWAGWRASQLHEDFSREEHVKAGSDRGFGSWCSRAVFHAR